MDVPSKVSRIDFVEILPQDLKEIVTEYCLYFI